ncbi:MAG: hypothetical protein WCI84_05270 [Bacteroidota bacterium]
MKIMLHPIILLLTTAVLFQSSFAQRTVRMNIERMVSDAAMIVHGTVTNVESAVDPQTNILSTFVTFSVTENFFGVNEPSVTLKMVGGRTKRSTLTFAEMPQFKNGEEVYAMFYAPSKYGFTSPVGMGQGKFSVIANGPSGIKHVRNALNNVRLFSGVKNVSVLATVSQAATDQSEITAEGFSATIRSLVSILKK